ncbi:MAG: DUF692 family protein, partial [Candidatus Omnitrophica bacterium]|nr:DUF692 family protein [Candidatus Omnitrophota bacterium]
MPAAREAGANGANFVVLPAPLSGDELKMLRSEYPALAVMVEVKLVEQGALQQIEKLIAKGFDGIVLKDAGGFLCATESRDSPLSVIIAENMDVLFMIAGGINKGTVKEIAAKLSGRAGANVALGMSLKEAKTVEGLKALAAGYRIATNHILDKTLFGSLGIVPSFKTLKREAGIEAFCRVARESGVEHSLEVKDILEVPAGAKTTLHPKWADPKAKEKHVLNLASAEVRQAIRDRSLHLLKIIGKIQPAIVSFHILGASSSVDPITDNLKPANNASMLGADQLRRNYLDGFEDMVAALKEQGFDREHILLESLDYSDKLAYQHICDPDFIRAIYDQSGCGLLIDVAHCYVSARNLGIDPVQYIRTIVDAANISRLKEVHVSVPQMNHGLGRWHDEHGSFFVHPESDGNKAVRQMFRRILDLRKAAGITTPLLVNFETPAAYAKNELVALESFLKEYQAAAARPAVRRLVVYSGPSGVGKSPLWEQIQKRHPDTFARVVLYHSRPPRKGEIDGIHYRFRSEEEIRDVLCQRPTFVAQVIHGYLHGIDMAEVEQALASGKIAIVEASTELARKLKDQYPDIVTTIFVAPLTDEEIAHRAQEQGKREEEVIYEEMFDRQEERNAEHPIEAAKRKERAQKSQSEMACRHDYDGIVVTAGLHDMSTYQAKWDGAEGAALVARFMEIVSASARKAAAQDQSPAQQQPRSEVAVKAAIPNTSVTTEPVVPATPVAVKSDSRAPSVTEQDLTSGPESSHAICADAMAEGALTYPDQAPGFGLMQRMLTDLALAIQKAHPEAAGQPAGQVELARHFANGTWKWNFDLTDELVRQILLSIKDGRKRRYDIPQIDLFFKQADVHERAPNEAAARQAQAEAMRRVLKAFTADNRYLKALSSGKIKTVYMIAAGGGGDAMGVYFAARVLSEWMIVRGIQARIVILTSNIKHSAENPYGGPLDMDQIKDAAGRRIRPVAGAKHLYVVRRGLYVDSPIIDDKQQRWDDRSMRVVLGEGAVLDKFELAGFELLMADAGKSGHDLAQDFTRMLKARQEKTDEVFVFGIDMGGDIVLNASLENMSERNPDRLKRSTNTDEVFLSMFVCLKKNMTDRVLLGIAAMGGDGESTPENLSHCQNFRILGKIDPVAYLSANDRVKYALRTLIEGLPSEVSTN